MDVKINRSNKRMKTISARLVDGVVHVNAPAHLSDAELTPTIAKLVQRIERRQQKQELDDRTLDAIAQKLNRLYFNHQLQWSVIQWSTQQQKRYGSCTPSRRTIRISARLATMPTFVLEYVVMHELAHLLEANHSDRFWKLVYQYPKTERARGYLMAVGYGDTEESED